MESATQISIVVIVVVSVIIVTTTTIIISSTSISSSMISIISIIVVLFDVVVVIITDIIAVQGLSTAADQLHRHRHQHENQHHLHQHHHHHNRHHPCISCCAAGNARTPTPEAAWHSSEIHLSLITPRPLPGAESGGMHAFRDARKPR